MDDGFDEPQARAAAATAMLRNPVRPGREPTAGEHLPASRGWRAFLPLISKLAAGRRRADVVAVLVLAALPVAVFGLPALLGHPVWPGDDLTQNYPLRVLVGRQLAAGQLPLFDPYIWSGAPLLGDWNAAAAYPLTWLFAIMPGIAAWTINLAVTWAVAGLGMFFFLRSLQLRSLASFLGALSFAFAGAMPAQVGHLGLVAGMSWVPVQLLAILRLSQDRSAGSRLGWVCVLAAAFGLTILAGEPRAIDDAGLILVIYAAWRIARIWRRARSDGQSPGTRSYVPAAISVAGGLVLGTCLGAVQLLPGLAAVGTSQRAASSMALFSSGSLAPKWLLLMLVPDLLGGSGSFGQPSFFANYNLAEVTSYVGILPLVAALALLARLRFRQRPPEWLVWHIVAVVGVLFSLGGHTPLGHLLVHVPLFGDQRLQSRSIAVTDLALAVLLGYWADRPLGDRRRLAASRGLRRLDTGSALGILPPLAAVVIAVIGIASNRALMGWLGVSKDAEAAADQLRPWLIPYLVIGGGAIAIVVLARRLGPRLRAGLVAGFVVADVVLFAVLGVVAVAPGGGTGQDRSSSDITAASHTMAPGRDRPLAAAHQTAPARPISALGYRGRFAIYDPGLIDDGDLTVLGSPDLNVMSATPSVQGYSSIVDGPYAAATGAHRATGDGQDTLSPRAIADGVLGQLNATVLATPSAYLVTPEGGHGAASPGRPGTGRRYLATDRRGTWYFATPLVVSRLEVPDSDARQDAASGTQIGLVSPAGKTRWFAATAASARTLQIRPSSPVTSVAVIGRAGSRTSPLGPPSIVVPGRGVLVADGQLQDALQPPQWVFAGEDGSFGLFVNRDARGFLSIQALPGRSAAGASVSAGAGPAGDPVAVAVRSPDGIRLVRSVAAIPGWTASWQPRAGPAESLPVKRAGVVQAVDVPAGQGVVSWSYTPPWFAAGFTLSLASLAVIGLLLVVRRFPRFADARRLPRGTAAAEPAGLAVRPYHRKASPRASASSG